MAGVKAKYLGLSYTQLSREGQKLCEIAGKTGNWHAIVDDLISLRHAMKTVTVQSTRKK